MRFDEELQRVLPADLPHRDHVIDKAARHLSLIAQANEYMNLTRILSARDAAIKHVYDSVAPWRHFANTQRVLDAGTGAGFPGVPLAVVFPGTQFALAESIGKKARFLEAASDELELANVDVRCERAEQISSAQCFDLITARAVAPMSRLIDLFQKPMGKGARLLLYKGPDVEAELGEAHQCGAQAQVLLRYELPDGLGSRSLIEVKLAGPLQRPARARPR